MNATFDNEFKIEKQLTVDEKLDLIMASLSTIEEAVEGIAAIEAEVGELSEQGTEIIERLNNLGLDGDGFGVDRYDS